LIWTSDFIIQNYWVLILFFSTVFVLFLIYKNTKSWKESLENFVLNFPLIWKIYKNYIS
jgi:type II secretory pathway component PulF